MASPSTIPRLTDNEIDEEIMNEDLKGLGIKDDLSNMDLQEKKNLLSAIKESAETNSDTTPEKQDSMDTKINSEAPNNLLRIDLEFPDLPKPKSQGNKVPLSVKHYRKKNNLENQPPNSDHPKRQFCLPFCDDDDAPLLILPEDCPLRLNKKNRLESYGRGYEECEREVRNMIEKFDSWIKSYSEVQALRQLKISPLTKETVKSTADEEEGEEKSQKTESIASQSSTKVEDDIFAFISEESCTVTSKQTDSQSEVIENTLKGKTPIKKSNNTVLVGELQNEQDNDVFKSTPPSPFTVSNFDSPSWSNVNYKSKNKGKTRGANKNAAASCSTAPEIEMNFNEKWNSQTGNWDLGQSEKFTNRTSRNQKNNKEKQPPELKVQCPICQQDFLQSRIESHAAECDVFFSENSSSKSETRMSDTEVSSTPGASRQRRNLRGSSKRGN